MATPTVSQRNTIEQELVKTEKLENYVERQLAHIESLQWVIASKGEDCDISHLQGFMDDLSGFVLQQVQNKILRAIEGLPKHNVILNKANGQLEGVSPIQ